MSLRFLTCTFCNGYVLKLLRLETITFSDAMLSNINVVLCYVLSQYHCNIYRRCETAPLLSRSQETQQARRQAVAPASNDDFYKRLHKQMWDSASPEPQPGNPAGPQSGNSTCKQRRLLKASLQAGGNESLSAPVFVNVFGAQYWNFKQSIRGLGTE